jgi:sugar-specific transcriptional regulator TrmB
MKEAVCEDLMEIGLTESQARTYISLIENGPLTAKEISETSAVPYSRIYDVLGELVADGWILELEGTPKQYQLRHESYTKTRKREEYDELICNIQDRLHPLKAECISRRSVDVEFYTDWAAIQAELEARIPDNTENITSFMGLYRADSVDPFVQQISQQPIQVDLLVSEDTEDRLGTLPERIEKQCMEFAPQIWVTWFDWEEVLGVFPSISESREILNDDVLGVSLNDEHVGHWAKPIVTAQLSRCS